MSHPLLSEGQIALQIATGFDCNNCYDSGFAEGVSDWHWCPVCCPPGDTQAARQQLHEALKAFAENFTDPFQARMFHAARALTRTNTKRTVRGLTLGLFLSLSDRQVKGLIEALRNRWHLPIGSLRVEPFGYYWMATPQDCLAWFNTMKAQATSELGTAYRLIKRHYPELAGQLKIDFEQEG